MFWKKQIAKNNSTFFDRWANIAGAAAWTFGASTTWDLQKLLNKID